jgi:hypothetical protein
MYPVLSLYCLFGFIQVSSSQTCFSDHLLLSYSQTYFSDHLY